MNIQLFFENNKSIDVRGQIHIYDEDLALINKYLNTVNNGYFSS